MPILFPTSPTVGQVFTSGGRSWVWSGATWDSPSAENRGALAIGGTTGQMLTKVSNADYETQWTSRPNSGAATMGYQLLTTTYQSYITVSMTCTGRPVVVAFSAIHANMNSGANRDVSLRAQLDGVTVGYELGGLFSVLLSGAAAATSDGATFIVTPSAGTRSFTFQARANANSSCAAYAAQLSVFEV
jgi:hypothetical protein